MLFLFLGMAYLGWQADWQVLGRLWQEWPLLVDVRVGVVFNLRFVARLGIAVLLVNA